MNKAPINTPLFVVPISNRLKGGRGDFTHMEDFYE